MSCFHCRMWCTSQRKLSIKSARSTHCSDARHLHKRVLVDFTICMLMCWSTDSTDAMMAYHPEPAFRCFLRHVVTDTFCSVTNIPQIHLIKVLSTPCAPAASQSFWKDAHSKAINTRLSELRHRSLKPCNDKQNRSIFHTGKHLRFHLVIAILVPSRELTLS